MDPAVLDYLRQRAPELFPAGAAGADPTGGFGDFAQRAMSIGQDVDPAFAAAQQRDIEASRARTLGDYLTRGATLARAQPVPPSAPPAITHENVGMYEAQQKTDTARLQKIVNAMQAMREAQMAPADMALRGAQALKATQEARAGEFNLEDTSRLRTALAQGDSNATAFVRATAARMAGSDPKLQASIANATGQELQHLLPVLEKAYAAEQSAKARMVVGGFGGPGQGSPVGDLADAIVRGEQPPDVKGLYRWAGPVRAELAKRGFDLAKANLDWQATQKNLATLNGPQQLRIRQAAMTANESLDNIENLYREWKQLGGSSGFKLLNKASLAMSKSAPGRMGAVAQALDMNIADLTSELGVVYMGGNTPTDHALALAQRNLSADWNEQQFTEAVKQARQNLGYRLNSIRHSGPAGVGGPSRYAPQAAEGGESPAQPPVPAKDPLGIR